VADERLRERLSVKKVIRPFTKSWMDAEQFVALATEAHKQFETAVKSGKFLRNCLNGQANVITQINQSIPPGDGITKELEALES
jgi:hypothetical protein